MAGLAEAPEAATVHIYVLVAADAGGGDDRASANRELVAGVAIEARVLAVEDEFRALVVIEVPLRPAARVVALLALRPEPELVLVVLAVARIAVRLGVLVLRRRVAGLAFDDCVLPEQGEAREAVIETRLPPARLVVAGLAFRPELALVLVVLL